ncbi:hypothetical protein EV294_102262 [Paenibacillus sp. BK033]|nr:hypothetical protein EV294_102262 [Paenibacillus sp. BK033]
MRNQIQLIALVLQVVPLVPLVLLLLLALLALAHLLALVHLLAPAVLLALEAREVPVDLVIYPSLYAHSLLTILASMKTMRPDGA